MDTITTTYALNTFWVLFAAVLVFFMQTGFALVEAGFSRTKNTTNILFKNLMDFCMGSIAFWLIGYGIMYGAGNGFFGELEIFSKVNHALELGIPNNAFFIFQLVFAATAATIVSGAMAERTKFKAYLLYSVAISALIYPISGHWVWGVDGCRNWRFPFMILPDPQWSTPWEAGSLSLVQLFWGLE